jgi:predicted outer membrane protein
MERDLRDQVIASTTILKTRKFAMKFTSLAIIAMLAATPALAAGKPSQAFLKKAIEGNYAEVQMGKLAQQNGESADVKKYGQMLVDDHSAGNQKSGQVARHDAARWPERQAKGGLREDVKNDRRAVRS